MDVGDESRLVDDWIREIESTINGTPVEGARTEVALGHSEMKNDLAPVRAQDRREPFHHVSLRRAGPPGVKTSLSTDQSHHPGASYGAAFHTS